jgi:hypothetical protein
MRKLIIILTCFPILSWSQNHILRFHEIDQNGKDHLLTKTNIMVDINSQVYLNINKDNLVKKLSQHPNANPEINDLINLLNSMKDYLSNIEKLNNRYELTLIQFSSTNHSPNDSLAYLEAVKNRGGAYMKVIGSLKNNDSIFRVYINQEIARTLSASTAKGLGGLSTYKTQFAPAAKVMKELIPIYQTKIDNIIKKEGIRVSVAGWLYRKKEGSTPIHIPGYDNYQQGEFYEYNRFQLNLNEEQKKELKDLNAFFKNGVNANTIKQLFENQGLAVLNKLQFQIDSSFNEIKKIIENNISSINSASVTVKINIDSIKLQFEEIQVVTQSFKAKYISNTSQQTGIDLILSLEMDKKKITDNLKNIHRISTNLVGVATGELLTAANSIKAITDNIKESNIKEKAEGILQNVFQADLNTNIQENGMKLTDMVLKKSIDQLPEEAEIDLLYTGKRSPGDRLSIRLYCFDKDNKPLFDSIGIIDKASFVLMNALPSVNMALQYQFCLPFTGDSIYKTRFASGPGYSTLFKFGSRNMFYKKYVDVGLGANIAAYDFNRDGVPEFSVAGTVSLFKDYLQTGIGYNVNVKSAYWFFGIRIPLPFAPISLSQSNSSDSPTQ